MVVYNQATCEDKPNKTKHYIGILCRYSIHEGQYSMPLMRYAMVIRSLFTLSLIVIVVVRLTIVGFSQLVFNRKNIYACIINIYVPHDVKNQRALAKMTSQIMKNGQDGQEVVLVAPDKVNIPCLMHDTSLLK